MPDGNNVRHPPPVKRINKAKQNAFLEAYKIAGTLAAAGRACDLGTSQHYKWLGADDTYRERYELAREEVADLFVHEACRRAKNGVEKLKFHNGKPIMIQAKTAEGYDVYDNHGNPLLVHYSETQFSDNLLMFVLKAMRPNEYRERQETNLIVHGAAGQSGVLVVQPQITSAEEWEEQARTQQEILQRANGVIDAEVKKNDSEGDLERQ